MIKTEDKMIFKSGFVSIIGRPNVGKSTLLNILAGDKIAIMSAKPQTTRNIIRAIVTDDKYQIVFIDTPGLHKPKTRLGEIMVDSVKTSVNDVDAVLWMIEAGDIGIADGDRAVAELLKGQKAPVFLLVNKVDSFPKEGILEVINNYKSIMQFADIIPISAKTGDGVSIIMDAVREVLPEGPMYFSGDEVTDQAEKTICAEIIREKILMFTSDEVPHGIGVEVMSFKERTNGIIDMQVNVYCEKKTHKGIVIGKAGSMLKRIGSYARSDIENLLGTKVFLQIWVKVRPDWRNKERDLKDMGFK